MGESRIIKGFYDDGSPLVYRVHGTSHPKFGDAWQGYVWVQALSGDIAGTWFNRLVDAPAARRRAERAPAAAAALGRAAVEAIRRWSESKLWNYEMKNDPIISSESLHRYVGLLVNETKAVQSRQGETRIIKDFYDDGSPLVYRVHSKKHPENGTAFAGYVWVQALSGKISGMSFMRLVDSTSEWRPAAKASKAQWRRGKVDPPAWQIIAGWSDSKPLGYEMKNDQILSSESLYRYLPLLEYDALAPKGRFIAPPPGGLQKSRQLHPEVPPPPFRSGMTGQQSVDMAAQAAQMMQQCSNEDDKDDADELDNQGLRHTYRYDHMEERRLLRQYIGLLVNEARAAGGETRIIKNFYDDGSPLVYRVHGKTTKFGDAYPGYVWVQALNGEIAGTWFNRLEFTPDQAKRETPGTPVQRFAAMPRKAGVASKPVHLGSAYSIIWNWSETKPINYVMSNDPIISSESKERDDDDLLLGADDEEKRDDEPEDEASGCGAVAGYTLPLGMKPTYPGKKGKKESVWKPVARAFGNAKPAR